MLRALRAALACALITLAVTGTARAAGGDYVFAGGTPQQQREVRSALEASTFPWNVVPRQIVIHVAKGLASEATPGQIWLDANLLDTGTFSWGLVQHEYAHQVDFLMLNDAVRTALTGILGGRAWCWNSSASLAHAQYGCERFASTLAWSFWQSPDNALAPRAPGDEAAALEPARFRALIGAVLRARSADDQLVTIQAFVGRAPTVTPEPLRAPAALSLPAPASPPAPPPATARAAAHHPAPITRRPAQLA